MCCFVIKGKRTIFTGNYRRSKCERKANYTSQRGVMELPQLSRSFSLRSCANIRHHAAVLQVSAVFRISCVRHRLWHTLTFKLLSKLPIILGSEEPSDCTRQHLAGKTMEMMPYHVLHKENFRLLQNKTHNVDTRCTVPPMLSHIEQRRVAFPKEKLSHSDCGDV